MYESPIKQITTELQFAYENECMKVIQGCGFDVNKEELLKALQYDREQYNKGYADAIDECIRMIEETPWKDVEMLVENIKQMKGGAE